MTSGTLRNYRRDDGHDNANEIDAADIVVKITKRQQQVDLLSIRQEARQLMTIY